MSNVHWRKLINPDYLGAYSLDNGDGTYKNATVTIVSAEQKDVTGPDGTKKKLVIGLKEFSKPMILNATNARTLQRLYKTPYVNLWVGRQFEVGVESVRVGPSREDALRIKPFVPRAAKPAAIRCENCAEAVQGAGKLSADQVAAYAKTKFGQALCVKCATALNEKAKAEAEQTDSKQADSTGEEGADAAPADSNGQ